jgi:uncharacterized OB-fold protein
MAIPRIWRQIEEKYNLVGTQCKECQKKHFPPREVCSCGCYELEKYQFIGKGEIVTYTVIRISSEDNEDVPFRNIPYVLAIIRLEEGPSLTAQIVQCSESELMIGKKVEMVFRKLLEKGEKGVIQYGYKFRIA